MIDGQLTDVDGKIRCFVADENGQRIPHGTLFTLERDEEAKLCLYRCANIAPQLIIDLRLNTDASGAIIFE
jgi:hypothetical protein